LKITRRNIIFQISDCHGDEYEDGCLWNAVLCSLADTDISEKLTGDGGNTLANVCSLHQLNNSAVKGRGVELNC
jgi:hypothetical protein